MITLHICRQSKTKEERTNDDNLKDLTTEQDLYFGLMMYIASLFARLFSCLMFCSHGPSLELNVCCFVLMFQFLDRNFSYFPIPISGPKHLIFPYSRFFLVVVLFSCLFRLMISSIVVRPLIATIKTINKT